ncbi:FkbM family methyltransferase [Nocardioides ferulae]|uniref:FkbM family methyltransferase n=1 Tax=Nocardioides ferulae TaxID=2340821 RepID=UPI000EAF3B30|nr:FkbM family methyltransferase [Nocardioides ferulae]
MILRGRPRVVAQTALRPFTARRRLTGTPYTVTFPAWQNLMLLKPHGMRYEPAVAEQFKRYVPRGGVVVDVGANLGILTMLAAMLVGKEGHVHSFEPDPQSMRNLLRNIHSNGLTWVTPWSVGLTDTPGIRDLYLDLYTTSTSSLLQNAWTADKAARQQLKIVTTTLDDVFAGQDVDFIKIDVEGAEMSVLAGARQILARQRPTIVVEVLREHIDEFIIFMREIQYQAKALTGDSASGGVEEISTNFLATPSGGQST